MPENVKEHFLRVILQCLSGKGQETVTQPIHLLLITFVLATKFIPSFS